MKQYRQIYLSMPITGYDIEERQKYAIAKKKELVNNFGCEVITPFESNPFDPNRTWEECMRGCLTPLAESDAIYFCENWQKSRGCLVEYFIASNCGIEIIL